MNAHQDRDLVRHRICSDRIRKIVQQTGSGSLVPRDDLLGNVLADHLMASDLGLLLVDIRPVEAFQDYALPGARQAELADVLENPGYLIGAGTLIIVDRGKFQAEPESLDQESLDQESLDTLPVKLYASQNHGQDWLNCVRSRKLPICDVEIGCRSVTVCHLGNLAYWNHRRLKWNPKKGLLMKTLIGILGLQEIGWSRGAPPWGLRPGVAGGKGPTPVEVYDNLYKQWKPDRFNAREWVRIAWNTVARYLVFLIKHHDGFCLFDTKLTGYRSTVPESAWKVDVMKEIAAECRKAGMKLVVYYSQPDWHHPEFCGEHHERYVVYLHGQVRELLTRYGKIDGLWFDGLGAPASTWDAEGLFKMARQLQPWLIINNRCGLPGDYDTPEQCVGHVQFDRLGKAASSWAHNGRGNRTTT